MQWNIYIYIYYTQAIFYYETKGKRDDLAQQLEMVKGRLEVLAAGGKVAA